MSRIKRSKTIKDFTKRQSEEISDSNISSSPFCLLSEKIPSPFIDLTPKEPKKEELLS